VRRPPRLTETSRAGRWRLVLSTAVGAAASVTLASCTVSAAPSAVVTAGSGSTTSATTTTIGATPSPTNSSSQATVSVVDDSGQRFAVSATTVTSRMWVLLNGWLRSSSPHNDFLSATLTVSNRSGGPQSLEEFDDPASGLAGAVDFVMEAPEAAASGYGADCDIDSGYPPNLCPITFPQGLTVDSDSAYTGGSASPPELAAGASAQIEYSYGPVTAAVSPTDVAVYFAAGASGPVDLSG